MSLDTPRRGADLHAHTHCSDGEFSPAQLIEQARCAGLAALAITDHDTVAGVAPARTTAAGSDLEVVGGVEITSCFGGRELHLLGLFVDHENHSLSVLCSEQFASRAERAVVMVERINRLAGTLELHEVEAQAVGAPLGRPHMARAMVARGLVPDMDQAFQLYLGVGRSCHVSRRLPPTPRAIAAVHAAGGVAVVAHPGSSRIRDKLLSQLADCGLDGVEVRHPKHPPHREHLLLALCRRLGLLPSGGSDFHGPRPGASHVGQYRVPVEWLEALRRRAGERTNQETSKESRA